MGFTPVVNLYTNTLKKGERTVLLEERYAMGRNLIPPYWKILSNNLCDLHLLYSHADPLITTRVYAKKEIMQHQLDSYEP